MALNLATFKTRSLTAAVFVLVMLAGLLVNHWTFLLLFSIIQFGCWWEYFKLQALIHPGYGKITNLHRYAVMVAGWSLMLLFTNRAYSLLGLPLSSLGCWLGLAALALLLVNELLLVRPLQPANLGYSLLGLVYISLSWALMISLRSKGMVFKGQSLFLFFDFGRALPLLLIVSIWINDTMAYIVGSLIGRTPFSKISPKKTWEGTLGGALLCILVMALAAPWFGFIWIDGAAVAAIAAVVGTAGDLLESKLKRLAGVKDSGQLMPGHGGFLDRFDSLLLATPVAWLYVTLLMY